MRPFTIEVSEANLADLKSRLAGTRWPERETVDDWSQGLPLRLAQEMCSYWESEYDWRASERRLNSFAQFTTEIDDLVVHFVHVKSANPGAIPIVLTHGWPGSFVEYLKVVGPLVDPVAHGGAVEDSFDVVLPSLPGYAFSGKPTDAGWGVARVARAWAALMSELGYKRFAAGGSDWGTSVSASLGIQFPERVIGLHLIPPLVAPDPSTFDSLTRSEQAAIDDLAHTNAAEAGYSAEHATKPQTIGYALVDSPAALCSWVLEKFWSWSDNGGDLHSVIGRDEFLDNLMMYWIPGTGASSVRMYWESFPEIFAIFNSELVDRVTVPVGASIFPRENPRVSERWAARRFTDIRQWHELERGGHFPALEQPSVVVAELASFFRLLR